MSTYIPLKRTKYFTKGNEVDGQVYKVYKALDCNMLNCYCFFQCDHFITSILIQISPLNKHCMSCPFIISHSMLLCLYGEPTKTLFFFIDSATFCYPQMVQNSLAIRFNKTPHTTPVHMSIQWFQVKLSFQQPSPMNTQVNFFTSWFQTAGQYSHASPDGKLSLIRCHNLGPMPI